MAKACMCGSEKTYEECCARFIEGIEIPKTALELMRSRYSAYTMKDGQYLFDTCSVKLQNIADVQAIKEQNIEWVALKVESFSDDEVTFMAYYKENNKIEVIKEHSFFSVESGRLKYDRGEILKAVISRNESCPCGSGKKYKRCCG